MALDPRSPLALPAFIVASLGPIGAARVFAEVAWRLLRGEPFASLPPATSQKERESRRQAAPVFVLHRVLVARQVPDALELVARIVEVGGVRSLSRALGPLSREAFGAMDDRERRAWVDRLARSFPNARPDFQEVSAQRVRFTVHHCTFVTLAHAVGEPALATVFCRADEAYFGKVDKDVELIRPHTLARGGPECPFELRFVDEPSPTSR